VLKTSRLMHLHRDQRDTLWLLTLVGAVVLLQAAHLPLWCTALATAVLLWRAVLSLQERPLPSGLWRVALLALALTATAMTHRTVLGREAGITLIVVLLSLKTLEMRARRDSFVVFFLSFFALLTSFFDARSWLSALSAGLVLLGLQAALINAHAVGPAPLAQSARTALRIGVLGAPIMLVLWLLLAQTGTNSLWSIDKGVGRSGLADQMRVGQLAELVQDTRVALRVRFEQEPPPTGQLYFRGPVLSDFDGQQWRPLRSGFPAEMALNAHLQVQGEPVRYEVSLAPQAQPWLYVLDAAASAPVLLGGSPPEVVMTPDLQWRTARYPKQALRYQAQSHTAFRHGPLDKVVALQDHLELPPGFNPRTLELAQAMRREHGTHRHDSPALVDAALQRLRSGGYRYTLTPGLYGPHTADDFWFERREGFCEHIASAFVVLMRALDIPARIVTGYQGGAFNADDNTLTVRQLDAHAWAEVWLPGQGWIRVDPTSAVAPERTSSMERLQPAAIPWAWSVLVGFALLILIAAVGTIRRRQRLDPWKRLLNQARQRLQDNGLLLPAQATPRAMAQLVTQHWGDAAHAQAVQAWLLRLEAQRYGPPHPSRAAGLDTLRHEFHQLPWPRPSVS
jgi:protein-glutamine gamma-glutamyltransferase